MISVKIGGLFESKAQTWVNTVNCVGIMGAGIALEFKKRFPEMFKDYAARCARHEVKLGNPYVFRLPHTMPDMFMPDSGQAMRPELILNFPTKDHWRSVSRLSDIVTGLEYLERHYRDWGITSLAMPPLGCGHGQLEWRVVGPTLYRYVLRLGLPVELFAPFGTPQDELSLEFLAGESKGSSRARDAAAKIDPAWVALATIVERIENEPYHWRVGRTTFQKIAYFATALGLPTGLQFRRASYGPFSDQLKPLIAKLTNNGILSERQEGQRFSVEPGQTYKDAARVFAEDLRRWEPILDRVSDLFLRMQTKDAEIAATVYFVSKELSGRGRQPSEMDVLQEVKHWKQKRRPPLEDPEVAAAIRKLNVLRWVDMLPSQDLPLQEDQFEFA